MTHAQRIMDLVHGPSCTEYHKEEIIQALLLDNERMALAIENLKPMLTMYWHQTFREGKDGPMKTELIPTYSGQLITETLAAHTQTLKELAGDV